MVQASPYPILANLWWRSALARRGGFRKSVDAVEQADEADDRARHTPRDTEEGFGVLALRRAPRARSLSAVFDGRLQRVGGHRRRNKQIGFGVSVGGDPPCTRNSG